MDYIQCMPFSFCLLLTYFASAERRRVMEDIRVKQVAFGIRTALETHYYLLLYFPTRPQRRRSYQG